ncbi:barstar family protein [Paenibacillus bovis]|uniref:Barstar (barnase inhibitor) domain-containing protein n=1 Tax=Paenibacillus bovis TaxID=1616788 RepID=A0A172ZE85_9BACL|nr:barstar family protein [Paenibacillus bovis]ANF95956.1 hypothetical protein AR543_08010 [Paenibacillus bovis]
MLTDDGCISLEKPYFYVKYPDKMEFSEPWIQNSNNSPNVKITFLDGDHCTTVEGLFKEFNEKFDFPSYFGWNWNALDECLSDLDWLDAHGHIACIRNAEKLLGLYDSDLLIILDILKMNVLEWNKGRSYFSPEKPPMPFNVIFYCSKEHQEEFIKKLQKANIHADVPLQSRS